MKSEFDSLLSVKIDEKSIGLDEEQDLSCVYILPSHSRYGNEEHFDDLNNFLLTYTNYDYVHVFCVVTSMPTRLFLLFFVCVFYC